MTAVRRLTRGVFSSLRDFLYCVGSVRLAAAATKSRREGKMWVRRLWCAFGGRDALAARSGGGGGHGGCRVGDLWC